MKVLLGKNSGFCFGVKRAVDGSMEASKKTSKIYCLGELVHNNYVISSLEKAGVTFVENLNEVEENATVIIRAHGVPKEIYEIADKKNLNLIDYTCPKVLNIHKIAKEYNKNNYFIILTGKKEHPEIVGITSYCNQCVVIETKEELPYAIESFKNSKTNKLLLISQTTYSIAKFNEIKKELECLLPIETELTIKNTICNSTELRQKEAEELSKTVDMMIIIGGKNSSNTQKLYEVSAKHCKKCLSIESKENLDDVSFNNVETVGIMAGASTPDSVIRRCVTFFK